MAATLGVPAIVEALLKAGANAKEPGPNGETTLMLASRNGNPAVVKLFIAAEAATLGLNWCAFQFLIRRLAWLPPELVSFVGTGLVFVVFAYPLRRHVIFRV